MTDKDPDADLFRRHVGDIKPLRHEEKARTPRKPTARARFTRADEQHVLEESLSADIDDTESSSGESLRFMRDSVTKSTMRQFTRGRFAVQGEIDLHGLTAQEAATALREFVEQSRRRRHRCILVVHGKGLGSGQGGPVLKSRVNGWLRRWNDVLAFVSARQVDGGTGAVYVLLKQ